MKIERRDLYDQKRRKTGEIILVGSKTPPNRYYVTVIVWIQNTKGEFLIQKRAEKKGGKWATTGGHPKAGESSLTGMVAEIKEELGLAIAPSKLEKFKTIPTDDDFVDLYYCQLDCDIEQLSLQKEEVSQVKWARIAEIKKLIKTGVFSASHAKFFEMCLQYLNNKPENNS